MGNFAYEQQAQMVSEGDKELLDGRAASLPQKTLPAAVISVGTNYWGQPTVTGGLSTVFNPDSLIGGSTDAPYGMPGELAPDAAEQSALFSSGSGAALEPSEDPVRAGVQPVHPDGDTFARFSQLVRGEQTGEPLQTQSGRNLGVISDPRADAFTRQETPVIHIDIGPSMEEDLRDLCDELRAGGGGIKPYPGEYYKIFDKGVAPAELPPLPQLDPRIATLANRSVAYLGHYAGDHPEASDGLREYARALGCSFTGQIPLPQVRYAPDRQMHPLEHVTFAGMDITASSLVKNLFPDQKSVEPRFAILGFVPEGEERGYVLVDQVTEVTKKPEEFDVVVLPTMASPLLVFTLYRSREGTPVFGTREEIAAAAEITAAYSDIIAAAEHDPLQQVKDGFKSRNTLYVQPRYWGLYNDTWVEKPKPLNLNYTSLWDSGVRQGLGEYLRTIPAYPGKIWELLNPVIQSSKSQLHKTLVMVSALSYIGSGTRALMRQAQQVWKEVNPNLEKNQIHWSPYNF